MYWLWKILWVLACMVTISHPMLTENRTSVFQPTANYSNARMLPFEDRQDTTGYQSYYPYPTYGPPPSYGPPTEIPLGNVELEFAFDEIALRCIAEEPFEHIVWIRYRCPQQFLFGGEGHHVADGSNVYERSLYDVHIRGHEGTIVSELLIKQPLAGNSEGIYQCEVWPHMHGSGYHAYGHYQSYNPPKSDVFLIGGSSLLNDCYHVNSFGHQANKVPTSNNKGDTVANIDMKIKQNLASIKPRRNFTDSRKNNSSKHLQYNLNYVDSYLYNSNGENVTADFFRPMNTFPLKRSFNQDVSLISEILKAKKNVSSPDVDLGKGRPNDKFREMFLKV